MVEIKSEVEAGDIPLAQNQVDVDKRQCEHDEGGNETRRGDAAANQTEQGWFFIKSS